MSQIITRDELAARIGWDSNKLRRRERKLGLHACKIKLDVRPPQYRAADALALFRKLGFPV